MARRRTGGRRGFNWGLWGGLLGAGAAVVPLIPVIRRKAMRVTAILKKDHRIVSGLMMTLEMTPRFNSTVRKALFNQIHDGLMAHTQAEEEVFYPAVRNISFGQADQVNEAYREHDVVKSLLREMANMDVMSDGFNAKLAELKNDVAHHVEEEENEIFALCEGRMSEDQLQDLGRRLSEKKKEIRVRMAA